MGIILCPPRRLRGQKGFGNENKEEIQKKIDEYMEKLDNRLDGNEKEQICCIIDALLWVIGDESGKPI